MRFAAAITNLNEPQKAAQALLLETARQLGGLPCHAAFLFVSILYRAAWEPILRLIWEGLGQPLLLGCTAGGVLGGDQELESTPAMSLAAAHLPDVKLHPFTVSLKEQEEQRDTGFWIEKLGAPPDEDPIGILFPEPFSCNPMALVACLHTAYPKMPLVGGLASGAQTTGENALFLNNRVLLEGTVGVVLTGDIALQTVVSQGCRPIGRPYIVTKAQENIILELAGTPATEALRKLFEGLSEKDRALAQRALLLGVVMNEQKETFKRGDFLIRNLIGLDPNAGAMVIGDRIQVGQTVQFQLRDGDASREDLKALLAEQSETLRGSPLAGGLLFSCLGRGRDLYGEPHHDIRTIRAAVGEIPIAGFFCNGEIGPVGKQNFIHGFTSSLGLFRPKRGTLHLGTLHS